ncbi:MAG: LPS export ABC transporter periplasmic protein LptC [Thermodesulfobacteriota bacterium]
MKKTKFIVISLIILATLAVIKIFINNYAGHWNQVETIDSVTSKADVTIKNIHYIKTNRGVKEWEIKASSGQYFKNKDMGTLRDITVKIFFKDAKPLTLTGNEGKVITNTRDIEIWGNVVVSSDNRYQFHTQSLKYSSKKREIYTPDKIEFTGYGMELSGVGMTIDVDRGRFFVLNDVSTIVKNLKRD